MTKRLIDAIENNLVNSDEVRRVDFDGIRFYLHGFNSELDRLEQNGDEFPHGCITEVAMGQNKRVNAIGVNIIIAGVRDHLGMFYREQLKGKRFDLITE